MPETNSLDIDRIMYEIRDAVARQHGDTHGNGSAANVPAANVSWSAGQPVQNGDALRLQPAFQPKLDKHYHVNDLLRFHGFDFLRNSYVALLLREPDEIGVAQHLDGLASGRFNKLDILASLHSSSEGQRNNVRLDGLSLPLFIRRVGRVPLIGYFVRLFTAIARLPLLVQHQNRFEFYLWSQLDRVVDYQNQSKREANDARAQISAQILEALQRTTEQQQALESALRQYEALSAQQTELRNVLGARMAEVRDDLESTKKLAEQIASRNAQLVEQLTLLQNHAVEQKQNIENLSDSHQVLRNELTTQQSALKAQQRSVATLLEAVKQNGAQPSFANVAAEEDEHLLDNLYASFEDRFRGEREEVQQRLEVYLPFLAAAQVTNGVLDVGSGRGEWLRLLRATGIECHGVDRNRVFVEECRRAGFEVVEADALAHLRSLPSESLNVVTSFHLVEHLRFEVLMQLIDEIDRTLKPGGLVILETPNPENFMVGSYAFYTDPTHRNPIPSQTLQFLLESRGFTDARVLKLRPWDAARIEGDSELIKRFNEYFYSAPDYGIIATKPATP
ncbi:MAG: methyltransferase domain-containing protein [Acidobacteria bacterium]|nr:methyltransferase domain-containing protein [Acidobacteriota bacterium]